MSRATFGIVGDVHLAWSDVDVRQLNATDYERVLFVGDLAAYRHRGGLDVARSIAKLERPALLMPGNHDGVHLGQLVAEITRSAPLLAAFGRRQDRRCDELRRALGAVALCGYSLHECREASVSIIAARPHSMGGDCLAFRKHLKSAFGVVTMEDSARRLSRLVDEAEGDQLVFLAHNGPSGLGSRRSDIWGCDFRKGEGDFGDPDLRSAIEHARRRGRRVVAVIAGHMHRRLRGGGHRRWLVEERDTLFVNAARVPRVFRERGRLVRHHVVLEIEDGRAAARDELLPG